jgi:hypothetical protein
MTTDEALDFLSRNQPLPPTNEFCKTTGTTLSIIVEHFCEYPDDRCVSLLIGSINAGDAHGVYQLFEDVLVACSPAIVKRELVAGLLSDRSPTRYWCARFATNFNWQELVNPLCTLLSSHVLDERDAALTALEFNSYSIPRSVLKNALTLESDPDVRNRIQDLIKRCDSRS